MFSCKFAANFQNNSGGQLLKNVKDMGVFIMILNFILKNLSEGKLLNCQPFKILCGVRTQKGLT